MTCFSPSNPHLRLAWDASSLGDLMFCPYKYKMTYVDGWQGSQVDLEFGSMFAGSTEVYHKARCAGASLEDATIATVRHALVASWDDGPWGGRYETLWRCKGELPYRNSKGNRALCPWSHKGQWFPEPRSLLCGECGSETEVEYQYVPFNKVKNRVTLLRLITWYCLSQPEDYQSALHAYVFPDGTPAVELSYKLPLPWTTRHGEPYLLCGHFDKIGEHGETKWIIDNKTTKSSLSGDFFRSYSPHYQFDTYDLVGSLLFPDLDLAGIGIEAAAVNQSSASFGMKFFKKDEAQRQEHLDLIGYWIKQAEEMAVSGYWPMNKRSCFLCAFKQVCSQTPDRRLDELLNLGFTRGAPWDPTIER